MNNTPDAAIRSRAAALFVAAHRQRREDRTGTYRPAPGLSMWCAWEQAEARLALSIAHSVSVGVDVKYLAVDLAAFRLIGERLSASRTRYTTQWRAQREAVSSS